MLVQVSDPKLSFMNLPIANQMIDVGSLIILASILIGLVYKVRGGALHHFSYWQVFSDRTKNTSTSASPGEENPNSGFGAFLFQDLLAFRFLGTCSTTKRISHIAIFWGFVFLAVSTTLAFFTNPRNAVLPLYNPVKIFGNVGGILIIAGFLGMFYVRSREDASIFRLTRSDLFLVTLFLAVLSGFATQQTIYSSMGSVWVSSAFWVHMVLVVALLATAPFTKFFHAVTKPISLIYEQIDRENDVESLLPTSTEAASISTDSKND